MKDKPEQELKQIAIDIYKGLIFTDRHIHNSEDISLVFMPFVFMDKKQMKEFKKDPPGLIFEYIDKAGPRSINGMLSFFSMQFLSINDTKKAFNIVRKLTKAEETL